TDTHDISFIEKDFELPKLVKTTLQRAGVYAQYGYVNGLYYYHWENRVSFMISKDKIYYKRYEGCEEGLFRIFITSEALGVCLHLRGYFLLHGSCVLINSKATVFIGSAGAGKSTTVAAYAKHGFTVLSDDMIAIKVSDMDAPCVLAGLPDIKIWEKMALDLKYDIKGLEPAWEGRTKYLINQANFPYGQDFPLEAIVFLERPYSKKYKYPLSFTKVPLELVKCFPLGKNVLTASDIQTHFFQSIQLYKSVKMLYKSRHKTIASLESEILSQK
ncbi:MAG: hypothetical protein ACRCVT_12730, partial [Leadbetterella sp.]